jgi:hypothetical protein
MTRRFVNHGICILAAVVLLLAVMSSPVRPPASPSASTPPPNYLTRNFAILEFGHVGQFALAARPSLRELDSLPPEIEGELDAELEDEPTITSPPPWVCIEVIPSPCPAPYPERVSFSVACAVRPLRC